MWTLDSSESPKQKLPSAYVRLLRRAPSYSGGLADPGPQIPYRTHGSVSHKVFAEGSSCLGAFPGILAFWHWSGVQNSMANPPKRLAMCIVLFGELAESRMINPECSYRKLLFRASFYNSYIWSLWLGTPDLPLGNRINLQHVPGTSRRPRNDKRLWSLWCFRFYSKRI